MIRERDDNPITPAPCFHGGAFFEAIGVGFDDLTRRHRIINADVLDAWFPPAPGVIAALGQDLEWLIRTSPPTDSSGLGQAISRARGISQECILPTAGSSDAIFLAFRLWLTKSSRVLLLDPTYGEYAHVLERVIGCEVQRFRLTREDGYSVNVAKLQEALSDRYDLAVLVNPNSPTGRHVSRGELASLLSGAPLTTRFWIDETHVEYAGANESLETFAAASRNVVICKSMSKTYALSGVRAAYLCAAPSTMAELRSVTPPWSVSLPAQLAAVRALEDPQYYAECYAQTHALRNELTAHLIRSAPGIEIIPGVANFLLCHLPEEGPDAATVVRRCRESGLFVRDAFCMGEALGRHALRVAVKDHATNQRMIDILLASLS